VRGLWETPRPKSVHQQHSDEGKKEAQKPKQGAGVSETPVKIPKRGQQEHREDDCGGVVVIWHLSGKFPKVAVPRPYRHSFKKNEVVLLDAMAGQSRFE
jgi:hypothetical protein